MGNEPVTLPVTGLGPYLSLGQDQRVTRLGSEFSWPQWPLGVVLQVQTGMASS